MGTHFAIIQVRTHSTQADQRLADIWQIFSDLFCREHEVVLTGREMVKIQWTRFHWGSLHLHMTKTRLSPQVIRLALARILDQVRRELCIQLGLDLAEVTITSTLQKVLEAGRLGNVGPGL